MERFSVHEIMDNIPVPVVVLNSDYSVVAANSDWRNFLAKVGQTTDPSVKKMRNAWELFDFKNSYWKHQFEICLRKGRLDFIEPFSHVACHMKNVQGPQGEVLIWVSFLENQTGEQTRVESQEDLLQTMKLKEMSEMAATLAHEINNPLTIIYAKVQSLKEALNPLKDFDFDLIHKNLDKISSQSERIFKIVGGMRSFSRDSRKDPFSEVSLKKILDETVSLTTSKTRDLGIEVIMYPVDEDLKVSCRPSEMIQVFLNLLTNAIDAIKDSPYPTIKIEVEHDKDHCAVFVSDSGPGVSLENESKIFAPFFTTKPVGYGTGIGLSVSTRIMRSHNGQLRLDRTRGNSCFVVELPKQAKEMAA